MRSVLFIQDVKVYPSPDPLAGADSVEFFGQRPWRTPQAASDGPEAKDAMSNEYYGQRILKGAPTTENLDPARERNGILALQYREKNMINHSVSSTDRSSLMFLTDKVDTTRNR